MKKKYRLKSIILGLCGLSLFSCKTEMTDISTENKFEYEMAKLTNQSELDSFSTRGDGNIVDWQLSKEFAELWLEEAVAAGEYPENCVLWDIPIAVYDTYQNIKYYEFRVTSDNRAIACIVGAATKDYSCPIVYQALCENGYSDEISELYYSGKLNKNELPRIVDNGYPNVVFGVITGSMEKSDGFEHFIDPETGDSVAESDITWVASYDDMEKIFPELLDDEMDKMKMEELIALYKNDGKKFWEMAVANKGHIGDFAVRGGSKRTELDKIYVKKVTDENGGKIHNYRACGPTAEGFILDYLQQNYAVNVSWSSMDYDKKKGSLYSLLGTGNNLVAGFVNFLGEDGDSVTLPSAIGKAVYYHSGYKATESGYAYPKIAIENNLPGISLRTFGDGGMHYRAVIAYKTNGWWAFSWPSFKILDLIDCNNDISKKEGMWETYIPVHHFKNWNIEKK